MSANWPNGYAPNSQQRWIITTPTASKFLSFQLMGIDVEGYPNAACGKYDWVLVAPASMLSSFTRPCDPASTKRGGILALYCNSHVPPNNPTAGYQQLFTGTNSIIVEFCSDSVINGKGVKFDWQTQDGPPPATTTAAPAPPTNPPTPPKSCPPGVGGVVSLQPGQHVNITSPGFSIDAPYANNLNCTWTINSATGLFSYSTNFFDLEGYTYNCFFDYLLKSYTSASGYHSAIRYCGASGPNSYGQAIHTSQMTLQLVTDSHIQRFGFSVRHSLKAIAKEGDGRRLIQVQFWAPSGITTPAPTLPPIGTPCNTQFILATTATTFDFYSPHWPNTYGNNAACQYSVKNPYSNQMDVNFTFIYFHTEDSYDHLHIATVEGLQRQFDGTLTGRSYVFPTSSMFVVFDSDFSVDYKGFHIRISLSPRPFVCPSGQFKCATLNTCIPGNQRCDGTEQCPDNSDENDNYCSMGAVCGTMRVKPNIVTTMVKRAEKEESSVLDPLPSFIVNGTLAKPGSWPWTVSVHNYKKGDPDFQTCGASLIAPHWIVTAAHCVFHDLEPLDFHVKMGSWRDHVQDSPFEWDSNISAIYYHPQYDPVATSHDIALMRLKSPVPYPFNSHINSVCLPSPGRPLPAPGSPCVVTGWGDIDEQGDVATILRQAVVRVIDTALCNSTSNYNGTIDSTMFCAGYEAGFIDTCSGDSGGPLVCQDSATGKWILTGVTSWGIGCAEPQHPGVYSRVSALVQWVTNTVNMHD